MFAKMLNMDRNEVLQSLKTARAAIDDAIRWVADVDDEDLPSVSRSVVAICKFCKKPIFRGEATIRGVHRKPCYNTIRTLDRNGEVTTAELVAQGRLGERKPPGRPRKTAADLEMTPEDEKKVAEDVEKYLKEKGEK